MKPTQSSLLLIGLLLISLTGCSDAPVAPASGGGSASANEASVKKENNPSVNARAQFQYQAPPETKAENFQGFGSN